MPMEWTQLRSFSEAELIFDEDETRSILAFFFKADRQQIETVAITRELRNFAQGLLVEAVDATYAMGWIELAFRWAANPGAGMKKALQKLARSAARRWFKHLKNQSLLDVKIYESVRAQLARNFRSPFQIIVQAKAEGKRISSPVVFMKYGAPCANDRAWG